VGDAESGPIRLSFNSQLRVEFRGATVTSDAGLLLPRELDERLGLSALIERHLSDPRTGRNAQFPLADLFRQSIYSRLAGYEDTNDAERLAEDPTFRMLASRERRETSVALTSTLHRFETDVLIQERNYQGLTRVNAELVQHPATRSSTRRVVLDIDSSESPGRKSSPPTTATSSPSAIIRSSCSTRKAAALQQSCVPGMSTARKDGTTSCCPSSIGVAGAGRESWSGRTRRLRFRPSTRRWNAAGCATRSDSRPTTSWSARSRICTPGLGADQVTPR